MCLETSLKQPRPNYEAFVYFTKLFDKLAKYEVIRTFAAEVDAHDVG